MYKRQTLDPTKISGRCGRLKCCLRYEFDTYEEIHKQLPRVGAHIVTANGRAKVLNQQIIAEQLLIEMEDHRRMVIDASEVLSVIKSQAGGGKRKKTPAPAKATQNDNGAVNDNKSAPKKTTETGRSQRESKQSKRNRKPPKSE